jgi:cell division septum initiation protein DivIVA
MNGGDILNPKLQKVIREIERAKEKITELEASLPALEKQKTELENAEVIKAFRSADVAPADFTAFIEAYKLSMGGGKPAPAQPPVSEAPQTQNETEVFDNDED